LLNRLKNEDSLFSSFVKGFSIGLLIFLLISIRMTVPVHASGSNNWAIGVWYDGYPSGGGGTSFEADIYNYGLPGDSNGQSFAVMTATVDGYAAQIAIENYTDKSGYLYECFLSLSTGTSGFGTAGCKDYGVSGLLGGVWHTLELKITTSTVGSSEYDNMNWILDGTTYDTYGWVSCSPTPCNPGFTFDDEQVPQTDVESYDNTNTDFATMNVHGYFEYPAGTTVGAQYFYPAHWGANSSEGDCPLPSGAQSTNAYLARNHEAPNNAAVTGHEWSSGSYGASDEWGIGNYAGLFSEITDSDLSSSFCSPYPWIA
jgi:hypothetical protein